MTQKKYMYTVILSDGERDECIKFIRSLGASDRPFIGGLYGTPGLSSYGDIFVKRHRFCLTEQEAAAVKVQYPVMKRTYGDKVHGKFMLFGIRY